MLSALVPMATETRRSALWLPSGSAMVTMSASATSRLRSAMRRNERDGVVGGGCQDPSSDRGGGLQPLAPQAGSLVQVGVVDHGGGGGGEGRREFLVLGAELARACSR